MRLAARDLQLSLKLGATFIGSRRKRYRILLVAIVPTIRNLLTRQRLMDRNRLPRPHSPFQSSPRSTTCPPRQTDHLRVRKMARSTPTRLGLPHTGRPVRNDPLIQAMQACLAANVQLVTTQLDHELILTEVSLSCLQQPSS